MDIMALETLKNYALTREQERLWVEIVRFLRAMYQPQELLIKEEGPWRVQIDFYDHETKLGSLGMTDQKWGMRFPWNKENRNQEIMDRFKKQTTEKNGLVWQCNPSIEEWYEVRAHLLASFPPATAGLTLKKVSWKHRKKEFEYLRMLPDDETGFMNAYPRAAKERQDEVIRTLLDYSKGENLPLGYVAETTFFLWLNTQIIGVFRVRHSLNEALRNGAGHIGYGIALAFRGMGYGTQGLALTIQEARKIVSDPELYLSVHKDNPDSLKVQQKNGALIDHEDEKEYYTRIAI